MLRVTTLLLLAAACRGDRDRSAEDQGGQEAPAPALQPLARAAAADARAADAPAAVESPAAGAAGDVDEGGPATGESAGADGADRDDRSGAKGRMGSPRLRTGTERIVGDLDKVVIRRQVRGSMSRIGYCFEQRRMVKPDLQGSFAVDFTIGASGSVTTARGSGPDAQVARCMADVFKGIRFPAPRGGGVVQVHYPLTIDWAGQ